MKNHLDVDHLLLLLLWSSATAILPDDPCETAKADIVILMDDSGSMSMSDFTTMEAFVASFVKAFSIGPERVQIGLTLYSNKPRTQWHLNTHQDKESLLKAILSLGHQGGGTNTGAALNHILNEQFKPTAGMRADSKKIAVLITDGESQDDTRLPAQLLTDTGITLYVIGVKNADGNQLRQMQSDQVHVYFFDNFETLLTMNQEIITSVCNSFRSLAPAILPDDPCETAKADIVILMDDSSSVSMSDFRTMEAFVASFVIGVSIGPERVQIGLTLYSDEPRTQWHLNTHQDKESLLKAILSLGHQGGNTYTGAALNHILYREFKPTAGMRADSKKIAVLITDGESQDDTRLPAQLLTDTGITLYVIGVKDADMTELMRMQPDLVHVYFFDNFENLLTRNQEIITSVCTYSHSLDSVRLVNGSSLCSGRLEVKSNQTWSSVCNNVFDQQDAEVVCRELSCGPPSVLQGVIYGDMEAPIWNKEFQCGGNEFSLLDCRSSDSDGNTCSPGRAVGLTCSEPVRLVGEASRCAGELEVNRRTWRPVEGLDWTLKAAAVVCGQMNCGSAVSIKTTPSSSVRSVWRISFDCVQAGYDPRECASAASSSSILNITCSDSVRLVNGSSLCSGRLEVKSDQTWSLVCDDVFDQQDAEVVCRELSCGPPSVLQGGIYGDMEAPMWTKDFQCGGNESSLLDCRSSDSDRNTRSPGRTVGLTCSEPVRLVGGASRCAGELELKLGPWRPVDDSGWTLKAAAAACRELNCGSVVSTGRRIETSVRLAWKIEVNCVQSGSAMRECASSSRSSSKVTLVCSDLLLQPIISVFSSVDGVSEALQQGSAVFQGSSFIIRCSIQPQYPGGFFQLTFTSSNATHNYTQPAVNHSAHFLFPAGKPAHQGSYSCVYQVYVFDHNFSSESRRLSLGVSDPTVVVVVRLVVMLLILLAFISIICFTHKATRGHETGLEEDIRKDNDDHEASSTV